MTIDTNEASKTNETIKKMDTNEAIEKLDGEIKVWSVRAGKITQMKIHKGIFEIRPNYPPELDPIKVAMDFLAVYDIPRTNAVQAALKAPEKRKIQQLSDKKGISFAKMYNVRLYEKDVRTLYQQLPDKFSIPMIAEALNKIYPDIRPATAKSKGFAYIKWLTDNGYLQYEKTAAKTKYYSFIKEPFPVAQAEPLDEKWLKQKKELELKTMRES